MLFRSGITATPAPAAAPPAAPPPSPAATAAPAASSGTGARIGMVLGVLLLLGGGAWFALQSGDGDPAISAPPTPAPAPPDPVTVRPEPPPPPPPPPIAQPSPAPAAPATMALTRLRAGDTVGGLDLLSQALGDDPAALSLDRLGPTRHAELADALARNAEQHFANGDFNAAQQAIAALDAMAPFDPAVEAALVQRLSPWLASDVISSLGSASIGIEPAASAESEETMMYTVRRGDTLWAIARRVTGDGRNWQDIFKRHNQGVELGLGGERIADPHRLVPGQKIRVPLSPSTGANAIDYHVAPGESLSRIAARIYGDPQLWRHIQRDNAQRVRDPDRIYPGQVLVLTPPPGAQ